MKNKKAFELIYDEAWDKRREATKEFTKQYLNDIEFNASDKSISLKEKLEKINKICDVYDTQCKPAVEEWSNTVEEAYNAI